MKIPRFIPPFFLFLTMAAATAQEPLVLNKSALPPVKPVVVGDPVPVPETVGAAVIAGVGFLLMFRRRRYH